MGGDTLDAFTPLSHFTTRVHDGQMETTWTKIYRTITLPNGKVVVAARYKEEDYVPEYAGLLNPKVENPLVRRE